MNEVKIKLNKSKHYSKNMDEETKVNISQILSDSKEIEKKYFSSFTELLSLCEDIEENPIHIKLVLSNTRKTTFEKTMSKIITPILNKNGLLPDNNYGTMHTALIVGGVKLEFNDSSICLPSLPKSRECIMCLDLMKITDIEKYKKVIEKICVIIEYWNM
jgi:hypothetical protein